ncbi:ATP phosphoribosyltransferase regulatory subunit [Massilimicrobiota sp. SW1139]|uniref:ATP phosphoribosyltransferase regulatory subunit n=1 Tax=Massilimicrobiota sp. SW1139 TaxID=2530043 RepID=UPI00143A5779|nr:ATP phosphoribosyltransferase regulatory subunit [Massilimicrobiota sp. SW1139]NJE44526.1 ATP phosphoribosyltransferase regulatory subunit [Massilimicrobiota sp. SW1139]
MEEFKYLIPEESIDAIMNNVSKLRDIENDLRHIFVEHGYLEVLMPSFEYVELYNDMDIGIDEEKMFQYINYEGKRVALRVDFTVPLARLYSSQKENGEKRYCYFGKVYRKEKRHKGRSSEFFQAGIELLGKAGVAGDLECLELVLETMQCLRLKTLRIEMGSAQFYNRLVEIVDDEKFVNILKRRDLSAMKDFVESHHFDSHLHDLLLMLPQAFGDIQVLYQVQSLIDDPLLKEAIEECIHLYQQSKMKDILTFDLAMTPMMKYYTGIILKGYSPYSAEPIMNGGRYDKLMNHFQRQVPAIGFSYDLSHILKALEKEDEA